MVAIQRHDGINFIAHAYREQLVISNKRIAVQELRMLSSQHGQYVCLRRKSRHEFEACFSQQLGYLLGETVWDYLGRPDHLIYCEAIAESAHCFLVVIRNGMVYLDNKILSADVHKELLPIIADTHVYEVYTYGDVPVRDVETFGGATFVLPKKTVCKFHHLKNPLFSQLLPTPQFILKPLPEVLKSNYLRGQSRLTIVTILVLIVVLCGWWIFRSPSESSHEVIKTQAIAQLHPFEKALTSPNPAILISELSQKIDELYLMPGWKVLDLNLKGDEFEVRLQSEGGSLWYLSQWAKQHYYQLNILPDGAMLKFTSFAKKRKMPKYVSSADTSLDQFLQRMQRVLVDNSIHVEGKQKQGGVTETQMTLDLKSLSPDLLVLIGQELNDLPVSLSSVNMHLNNGLIDGKIQLSLWGR